MKADGDRAATLFVQELLQLQCRYPGSVFTNTFEISENGHQMACATLSYLPLSCQMNGTEDIINPKDLKTIEKLVSDVLSDVGFLWKDLEARNIVAALCPENIAFIKDKGRFFLGNWARIYEQPPSKANDLSVTVPYDPEASKNKKPTPEELADEIKALGLAILKLNKVNDTQLQSLIAIPIVQNAVYDASIKLNLKEGFLDSKKLQSLIENLINSKLPNTIEEESKLLAWSSYQDNNIMIFGRETKQEFAKFEGVKLDKKSNSIL